MSQLADLAKPFPTDDVHRNPSGGGEYVKHSTVTEKLLYAVGPFDYRIIEIIRGTVHGTPPNPSGNSKRAKEGTPDLVGAVVGCLAELTLTIDGRRISIVEVGDCEQPHNWPHDGARLKDASSDAIKRAAMRAGVGLSLWSQDSFRLHDALTRRENVAGSPSPCDAGPVSAGPALSPGVEAGDVGDGEAGSSPVVESSPTQNLINPDGNDTESSVQLAVAAGVVRDTELALDAQSDPDPAFSDSRAGSGSLSSARRRLDTAKGHK